MITFNNDDKRWLEIIFYLLCRKVFNNNQRTSDVKQFITGFRWTNMFNYDKLIEALEKEKVLLNPNIIPSKREFVVVMNDNNSRLRMQPIAIRELIRDTEFKFWRKDIFHTAMKEEIHKTEVFPKMSTPGIHETIYSFLLAIRYVSDLIGKIKF